MIVVLLVSSSVRADPALDAQARKLYQAGMAHFQLEEYEVAIQLWQQGFKLKPAPEFLYNIAQAYRLGSERAAVYYQKYLNRYPLAPNRAEVERQIAIIKRQAAEQKAAETPPKGEPVAEATCACPPPAAIKTAAPAPSAQRVSAAIRSAVVPAVTIAPKKESEPRPPAPVALLLPAPAHHDSEALALATPPAHVPLAKKKWFWATVGTAAVVAVGVGVGFGVGARTGDPVASFGVARGN
ncbi:MAG: hypothetical protein ACXVDD_02525 [Polyangia bacterium]